MEREIGSLIDALATGVAPAKIKSRIADRERELKEISKTLGEAKAIDVASMMYQLKSFAAERMKDVLEFVTRAKANAKYELTKHIDAIWMTPPKTAEGERFYFGVGNWDLLGGGVSPLLWHLQSLLKSIFRPVNPVENPAINLFQPATNHTVFGLKNGPEFSLQVLAESAGYDQNMNAHGAWLNVGVRNVAGAGFEPATFGL